MRKIVRKVIISVGWIRTRVLIAIKFQLKEILPIVDKLTLQYIKEEILIVTGISKKLIENHFDHSIELEHKCKIDILEIVR